MKLSGVLLFIALCVSAGSASSLHDGRALHPHHARLAARSQNLVAKAPKRRCKNRSTSSEKNQDNAAVVTSASKPKSSTHVAPVPSPKPQSFSTNTNGLINVESSCGNIGATKQTTATSGPNGSIDWLNCGVNDGGWRPPFIQVKDIKYVPLSSAVQSSGTPYGACKAFVHLFEKHGNAQGIPPILLAAFAMQESSCNPNTVGGAGEQGLMQITKDKCGGAPGGNCKEPDFNIGTAARYFATTLKENGNNLLLSIGTYNGWRKGLTYSQATAAAKTGCCRCQNNLDYLHQFVNGWLMNINAYDNNHRLGKYFNLDVCH